VDSAKIFRYGTLLGHLGAQVVPIPIWLVPGVLAIGFCTPHPLLAFQLLLGEVVSAGHVFTERLVLSPPLSHVMLMVLMCSVLNASGIRESATP
jgi:hypothetical protein